MLYAATKCTAYTLREHDASHLRIYAYACMYVRMDRGHPEFAPIIMQSNTSNQQQYHHGDAFSEMEPTRSLGNTDFHRFK